ncbi:MAG: hypothetical protein AAGF11_27030 [Myxococcota bacterium]
MRRDPKGSHRSTAVGLALTLAFTSTKAMATMATPAPSTPTEADEPPARSPTVDEARRLYTQGRAKFETADYKAAIEQWTEAYALVLDAEDDTKTRVLLLYNIATAREKAFEVSQDPTELRQAKILLNNFERSIPALYGEGPQANEERRKVQERLAEIEARLAAYEQEQGGAEPAPVEPPPSEPEPEPEPEPDPGPPAGRGLVIGGAVAAGLGVAGFGLMAAGLGMGARANDLSDLDPDDIDGRRTQFDRGRTGNALGLTGGITGGVLVVTGAVLLGLGLRKRGSRGTVALVPSASPQGTTLTLRGRF